MIFDHARFLQFPVEKTNYRVMVVFEGWFSYSLPPPCLCNNSILLFLSVPLCLNCGILCALCVVCCVVVNYVAYSLLQQEGNLAYDLM